MTIDGGLRRQIRVDLSREKITALNLSPDRVVQILRTENQNIPLGEVNDASRTLLLRSPGQFANLDEIRDLVVLTRDGVPVYLKDIADVRDATEDRRAITRINGNPGIRMRVTKQSGTNTIQVAEGVRAEIERINRDVTGLRLQVLDDQSVYIERAIHSVQEHAMIGGLLVIAIIFLFLRDLKSTLIICTSIPISVIGTFALLYFGGYTLNTLTFGGLALGHRHDRRRRHRRAREHLPAPRDGQGPHHRRDRRLRRGVVGDSRLDADAHRGVRADAVPDRRLEHHVRPARRGRLVLAGDVAAGGGDHRAGALLAAAATPPPTARTPRACSG